MEPVEITSPESLQERIAQGGVITVTRGPFADAIAHTVDCRAVKQIRIPTKQTRRYWWTPDYAAALTGLGARRCRQCRWPR
jgi:hypothetical protein